MVVSKVPSADVLMPKPQAGQARSLIDSGSISPYLNISPASLILSRFMPDVYIIENPLAGAQVESSPGASVIIGLVSIGPIVVHSSFTTAVPRT